MSSVVRSKPASGCYPRCYPNARGSRSKRGWTWTRTGAAPRFSRSKALEALKPEAERYDYWCWSLPGFGVRVNPTGRKTFSYVYRFGRRPRRKTIGRFGPVTLKSALTRYHADAAKVREAAEQLANGEAPPPELDPGAKRVSAAKAFRVAPTLKEAATAFLTDIRATLRPTTVAEYERAITGYLLPSLGDQKPKSIRKRDLIAILDAIAAGEFRRGKAKGKPSRTMAESAKRVFSAFFGWMAKREIIDAVPTVFMPRYQAPIKRDRFLTDDERKNFLAAVDAMDASDPIKGALKIALLTGQRIGAISSHALVRHRRRLVDRPSGFAEEQHPQSRVPDRDRKGDPRCDAAPSTRRR